MQRIGGYVQHIVVLVQRIGVVIQQAATFATARFFARFIFCGGAPRLLRASPGWLDEALGLLGEHLNTLDKPPGLLDLSLELLDEHPELLDEPPERLRVFSTLLGVVVLSLDLSLYIQYIYMTDLGR